MLRSFKALKGYSLHAIDGDIGSVVDLYFDDRTWMISHLVVQSGNRITGRKVLLSAQSLGIVARRANILLTPLTRTQVGQVHRENQVMPVSQQRESEILATCGWGAADPAPASWMTLGGTTWDGMSLQGTDDEAFVPPSFRGTDLGTSCFETTPFDALLPPSGDEVHRRSANEVHHYNIAAQDGLIGHISDFLVDDEQGPWAIRHLVVRTGSWPIGRKVLLAAPDVESVDWERKQVQVRLSRAELRGGPLFDAATPMTRRAQHDNHSISKHSIPMSP